MELMDLGLEHYLKRSGIISEVSLEAIGRVAAVHKDRYLVFTHEGLKEAEITGQLRYSIDSALELPCVGDWVQILPVDEGFCIVQSVLPRYSLLKRKAAGNTTQQQAIAANIDYGLIMMAVDRDFSLHRLQQYLVLCHEAGIEPVLIISKVDTIDAERLEEIKSELSAFEEVPTFYISNLDRAGVDVFANTFHAHYTYCLLGSSRVGKSTLINSLMHDGVQKTAEIGEGTERGNILPHIVKSSN